MKVHHIAITVHDLNKSIQFYSKYFNFKLVIEFEKKELQGKAALLQLEEFHLELWQFPNSTQSNNLDSLSVIGIRHLAFEVNDCEKEVKRLTQLGLTFSEVKQGVSCKKYAFTNDPSGIPIELYQK